MKNVSNDSVQKPSKFWTGFVYTLLWPTISHKYDLRIDKKVFDEIEGPYVLVCNHAMFMDPFFVYGAIYPELVNFVGGYNHFNNKLFRPFLKKMGAIPKFQYQSDLKAMRDMLTCIKRGNNLGLFPAGRNSSCGEGFYIPNALAKLLKMCKAQVITCHIDGSYLVHPKWSKVRRKGPIFMTFKKCLTADEIINKSEDEITKIINEHMQFNDYKFNKEHLYHYRGKKLAEGLETTCYICPRCGKKHTLKTKGNNIYCDCGFSLELLDTGFFKKNEYFESPFDWFEYQRTILDKSLDKKIIIEDDCSALMNLKHGLTVVGNGHVLMNEEEIIYKGTINKEEKELHFPIRELMSLPYRAGENFEIADATDIYQFKLKNGNAAAEWCQLVEQLYKKHN